MLAEYAKKKQVVSVKTHRNNLSIDKQNIKCKLMSFSFSLNRNDDWRFHLASFTLI